MKYFNYLYEYRFWDSIFRELLLLPPSIISERLALLRK